jgi:cell division septal protein FtsQ
MADPPKPTPDDVPPDTVLVELLAAFSNKSGEPVDFDDPAIDKLLGLADDTDADDQDDDDVVDDLDDLNDLDDLDSDHDSIEDSGVEAELGGDLDTSEEPDVVGEGEGDTGRDPVGDDVTPTLIPTADLVVAPASTDTIALDPDRKLIVIGDDDDRPDAMYLDEEAGLRLREVHSAADESGGRSTIIIKDLDEAGSIEALPARSSGSMDPRVRARRIAVRRAKGRKRLIWVAIGAAVVLVLVGAVAVLASSLFDVRVVRVQGAVYTDQAKLSAIIDGLKGDAILLVDTRQTERQLETIPWIESARVSTQFPHTVFVDIRERKPVATFIGSDGGYRVIDRDGRVLDVVQGVPIDYMLITGANPDVEQGQFAARPFASAAQLTLALPSEIRAISESIGLDLATGTIKLQLKDGVEVQLGTPTDLSAKLAQLLSQVRDGLPQGKPVDLSTG